MKVFELDLSEKLNPNSVIEAAKLCYAFLHIDYLEQKEVGILNKTTNVTTIFREDEIPMLDDFLAEYKRNRIGIVCVGDIGKENTARFQLTMLPEKGIKKPPRLLVSISESEEVEELMTLIVDLLVAEYKIM